jgi:hypothetical protein
MSSRTAALGALLSFTLITAVPSQAADPAVSDRGAAYLAAQQEPNGGWDADPDSEFVTSEATLAVAEAAQSGAAWNAAEGLAALDALPQGSPLGFLDDVAEGTLTPGKAAKLIVLVASPLGFDPAAFDPLGDGDPVSLAAAVGAPNPDGSFGEPGLFNGTLFAAIASRLVSGAVPPITVEYIRAAQQPGGGWSFDGDATGATEADIDTTSLAVQALVAGGVAPSDGAIRAALAYLAGTMNADSTWSSFGSVSAESSSRALLAITASGYDVESPCWRDSVRPDLAATPYASPDAALAGLQQPDGSIAGPAVVSATYSTAQAIQGLERRWLPVARASAQTCAGPLPAPIRAEPTFTG